MSYKALCCYVEKSSLAPVVGKEIFGRMTYHLMPGIFRAFLLVTGLSACGGLRPGLAAGGFGLAYSKEK